MFIKNYGVTIEIPAYYYHDARFVPSNIKYVVLMAFHIIPKKEIDNVQTTFMDQRVENNSFEDLCEKTGKNLILSLNKVNGRAGLDLVDQIIMEGV